MSEDRTAFIAVDVQPDFCEEGNLPVAGGNEVAHRIAAHLGAHGHDYDVVVATRDYHVDPGAHFGDPPDFRDSWPVHCLAGTPQAELHPALAGAPLAEVFDKGAYAAAYSGFEGVSAEGERLGEYLRRHGVTAVDVAGLATDYCVAATARDAISQGFRTRVLTDLSAGVAAETSAGALDELRRQGAEVAASGEVLG
ncbi:MAG: isochorismatase family protein [Actinomycetota bacterium]|nr:isochorismatase family protein [Actinomycetota bacterium]